MDRNKAAVTLFTLKSSYNNNNGNYVFITFTDDIDTVNDDSLIANYGC